MHVIQIRFNTEKEKSNPNLLPWRVLVDGQEFLAQNVSIKTSSWTTHDEISPGLFKWHITCHGTPVWNNFDQSVTIM